MKEQNASLIAFIEYHDGCDVVSDDGDTLVVECGASLLKDGEVHTFRDQQRIPSTRKAVREWLGY